MIKCQAQGHEIKTFNLPFIASLTVEMTRSLGVTVVGTCYWGLTSLTPCHIIYILASDWFMDEIMTNHRPFYSSDRHLEDS